MRLIDQVLAYAADTISCRAVPKPDCVFACQGKIPAVVALEYMAQTVAAYVTLHRRIQRSSASGDVKPRIGFIIGARKLRYDVPHFDVGIPLTVVAHLTWRDEATASFECAVRLDGDTVASTQLMVYEPPELAEQS
jgi:predicted hotdog family 3-hydroxylacyl-ACP dehydratase